MNLNLLVQALESECENDAASRIAGGENVRTVLDDVLGRESRYQDESAHIARALFRQIRDQA